MMYIDGAPQASALPGSRNGGEWRDQMVSLIPVLRSFAVSLSRNAADADDLVQDTLIKALRHRDKFEPGTNLRAWLFTILRNTYYTLRVRRGREVRDEDEKYAGSLTTGPAQEWRIELRSLRAALDQLPAQQREALILVTAAGFSYEEAAEICGCAVGTVKSRIHRARERLLALMGFTHPSEAVSLQRARPAGRRTADPGDANASL